MVLGHDILTSDRTEDIKISEDVSFESMLLSPKILKGLKDSGFYVPSPIQLHGIPLGKCGFDLLLEAKSGTGKTAVFTIIALEKLNLSKGLQALMLAPTREIASQICEVIKTIGANFEGLTVEVVMGGLPFAEDVEKFKKTVHIVVGSPGRLYHLIDQKHIDVSSVRLMVLDEADKLMQKSYLPHINKIFSLLPGLKQMIMSSATYPEDMKTIIKKYVQNAHHICPDSNNVLLGIAQYVVVIPSHVNIVKQTKNRYEQLNEILSKKKFKQCLVFCNYQVRVREVHKMLNNDKWPADQLHGKQQQTDRLEALKVLQEYQCRILVSTDLAARGIDASNVDLVVNFEIPYDWQTYLHRIGRAGRFGSYGHAITILCGGNEENKFRKLLGSINIPFDLKHLWSEDPFPLDNTKTVEGGNCYSKENNAAQKTVTKFDIKDADDELRNILSADSSQPNKGSSDIPTFASLCESFEQANEDDSNCIESFTDLCASFKNHEIKDIENVNENFAKVKKLIIPCTMFDGNVILQSFENHKALTNKIIIDNDTHEDTVASKMITSNSQSTKSSPNKETVNAYKCQNMEYNNTNSEGSSKNKGKQSKGSKPTRNSQHHSETMHDVSLPSTSKHSEYEISTKSKANREAKKNENLCLRFGEIGASNAKNVIESKTYFDESVISAQNSDFSIEEAINYNDSEKALLAANLPTAFGKVKQNIVHSKTNKYISCNTQSIKTNEHQLSGHKKVFTKRKMNKKNVSVCESSDSDRTVSQSQKSLGGQRSLGPNINTKINVKQKTDFYESGDSGKSVSLRNGGKRSERHKTLSKNRVDLRDVSIYEKICNGSVILSEGKWSTKSQSFHPKEKNTVLSKNVKDTTDSESETSNSEDTENESVYESSNSDNTKKESVLLYYGGKKPTIHRFHHKKNKKAVIESSDDECAYKMQKCRSKTTNKRVVSKNEENISVLQHDNRAKAKLREFNRWYQELQANMRILDTFFYIAELKKLNIKYP